MFGNGVMAPLIGRNARFGGPHRARIFHQWPCQSVSPKCMTLISSASTRNEICGSPKPSTAGKAVTVNGPAEIGSYRVAPHDGEPIARDLRCVNWITNDLRIRPELSP